MIKPSILLIVFAIINIAVSVHNVCGADRQDMINHPEKYIKISNYGFYAAARVAIIHHVHIENTADIPYRNIKVKLYYYSTGMKPGQLLSSTSGILPVEIPPKSNSIYLRGGTTLGAGSNSYDARNITVLGAVPVTD